jgi:REP element-mobilizing transposase RayT
MRLPRLKALPDTPAAHYHCISRVVDRRFVFGDQEKALFFRLMRFYARFCQVRVAAYCLMGNHFHLLVEVPARPETLPSEAWLIGHVARCYGKSTAAVLQERLRQMRRDAGDAAAQKHLDGWFARLWDISVFMKTLKQRFTQQFNKQRARRGTLWEDRFRSMLVESGSALATMAAYIDLNPVRAGIVKDPARYRWSSYGAAMGGEKAAREGIKSIVATVDQGQHHDLRGDRWLAKYRLWLFGNAAEIKDRRTGQVLRKGTDHSTVERVLKQRGRPTLSELLRCRISYLTRGGALGTKAFIESLFHSQRWRFPSEREDGAKVPRGGDRVWQGLRVLRAARIT